MVLCLGWQLSCDGVKTSEWELGIDHWERIGVKRKIQCL